MQIWCVTTDYCRSLKKKLSPITSGMNDSPNYNNHNRKCHCENITNNSIDVCDVCEMQVSESERDVSVLVFWEKLKSPPATVSGESQDSPALGTAACRPVPVTSLLSILLWKIRWNIEWLFGESGRRIGQHQHTSNSFCCFKGKYIWGQIIGVSRVLLAGKSVSTDSRDSTRETVPPKPCIQRIYTLYTHCIPC